MLNVVLNLVTGNTTDNTTTSTDITLVAQLQTLNTFYKIFGKGGLTGLRQLFGPESSLKMMKNTLFVLKIFKFLS